MKRLSKLAVYLGITIVLGACKSESTANPAENLTPDQMIEQVTKKVKKNIPEVDSVRALKEVPGIYEVEVGSDVAYVEPNGKYAFIGQLVNLKTHENVTMKTQESRLRKAYKTLPFEYALKEVRGNGKRKLVLFSDPDCPFCRKIENELEGIDNVTIYTFMAPIPELHPEAARRSETIWCAQDPLKAWHDFMRKNLPLPEPKPDCDAPLEAWNKLKKEFRIRATPTLLFTDGKLIAGALPKENIEKVFAQIDGNKEGGSQAGSTPSK